MSQKEAIQETISGHKFQMFMMPPMHSHHLLMAVAKMVGPALGPVFDALFAGKGAAALDMELGSEFFTRAASALFSGLDQDVMDAVILGFRNVSLIDNKPLKEDGIFNIEFGGPDGLALMYAWLAWGMTAQWGKSFSALGDVLTARGANIKSRLQSQSTLPNDGSK